MIEIIGSACRAENCFALHSQRSSYNHVVRCETETGTEMACIQSPVVAQVLMEEGTQGHRDVTLLIECGLAAPNTHCVCLTSDPAFQITRWLHADATFLLRFWMPFALARALSVMRSSMLFWSSLKWYISLFNFCHLSCFLCLPTSKTLSSNCLHSIKRKSIPLKDCITRTRSTAMITAHSKAVIAVNSVLPSLAVLTIMLRLYARRLKSLSLGADDYTIIGALVNSIHAFNIGWF